MQQPQRSINEGTIQRYRIELETARRYIEEAGFSVGETVLVDGEYEATIANSPMLSGHVAVNMTPEVYAMLHPALFGDYDLVNAGRVLVGIHQLSKAPE